MACCSLAAASSATPHSYNNYTEARAAIYAVFGSHASEAMRVSYCETGGTYSPYAQNGQYRGIFQMGEWERTTYGHGSDVWTQARAAYRYFRASGYRWTAWSCKP